MKFTIQPFILQTWVFYPAGNPCLDHPHKNFHLPGMPGNVCRKRLKFPETPGNLYWWNCNIIPMTINEAYLVALRPTVSLTYVPVMALGLYDTFPGASWDISCAYWIYSWKIFDGNIDNRYFSTDKFIHFLGQYIPSSCLVTCSLDPNTGFLDLLTHFLDILVNFLDVFWCKYWYFTLDWFNGPEVKYQYIHQKKSRK